MKFYGRTLDQIAYMTLGNLSKGERRAPWRSCSYITNFSKNAEIRVRDGYRRIRRLLEREGPPGRPRACLSIICRGTHAALEQTAEAEGRRSYARITICRRRRGIGRERYRRCGCDGVSGDVS